MMNDQHVQPRRTPGLLAMAAALALGGLSLACVDSDAADAPGPVPAARATRVETLRAVPVSFDETIEITGAVEALHDATLAAQAAGTVEHIAELGETVARGDVLVRLERGVASAAVEQFQAQLETARAQSALARDTYERLLPLSSKGAISALELEQARLQLEQAEAAVRQSEAALAQARSQLEDTVVRAPFAGTVEQRFFAPGERAGVGDDLVRLVSVERVQVVAGVPERYAADLSVGAQVGVELARSSLGELTGTVSFVGAVIDPQSRTFLIEVDIDNPDRILKPAMLVDLSVVRRRHTDVIVVPRSAVMTDEYGPGLYVVKRRDGTPVAERRRVVLGAHAEGAVIVESGLYAGAEVVVAGQHSISEGDLVEVSAARRSPAELAEGAVAPATVPS